MKRLVLLLVFWCCFSVGFAQQIKWEKKWLGNQPQALIATIDKTSDSSIIASGNVFQFNGGPFTPSFIKYDKNGNQLWQKYGRVMKSGEQDIIAYGNGFLFAGTQRVQDSNNITNTMDIGLHWLSTNGDTLQNIRYGSPTFGDIATKILAVNNDIYVLATTTVNKTNASGTSADFSLLKLSNNGTTQQWFKTYGSNLDQISNYMLLNRRGNLVLSGISNGNTTITTYHPYMLEVNTNGDTIRSKQIVIKGINYWEFSYRMFHNIAETSDGNYIMSGSVEINSNTVENFIAKLDNSFNVIWVYYDAVQTSYHGFSKVQELANGSFAVLMKGDAAIPGDYHIVKVSSTGQFISRTTYNSPITGNVLTYDWEFLGDGSVVVAGKTSNNEAYIARLGNVGIPAVVSSVAEPIAREVKLGQSYPNPAASETTIPYKVNPSVKQAELRICEIATGKLIRTISLNVNAQQVNLDLKPIRQGVYSYTLYEDGMPTATKKMVVLK